MKKTPTPSKSAKNLQPALRLEVVRGGLAVNTSPTSSGPWVPQGEDDHWTRTNYGGGVLGVDTRDCDE